MTYGTHAAALALTTLTVLAAAPARGAAAPDPVAALKAQDARIKKTLEGIGDEVPAARRGVVREAINELVDFRELCQRSLRDHWDGVAAPKRDEFVTLLTDIIKDGSIKKLDVYKAQASYSPAQVEGDKATVSSTVETDEEEVLVVYKMYLKDGRWRIWDLVIDDISTVEDYRATFNKEIAKTGFDGLLQKLRDKRDGKEDKAAK
jgi:phospholipid transport system substrate-binding protein